MSYTPEWGGSFFLLHLLQKPFLFLLGRSMPLRMCGESSCSLGQLVLGTVAVHNIWVGRPYRAAQRIHRDFLIDGYEQSTPSLAMLIRKPDGWPHLSDARRKGVWGGWADSCTQQAGETSTAPSSTTCAFALWVEHQLRRSYFFLLPSSYRHQKKKKNPR